MNWHRMPCLGLWTADVPDRDLSFLLRHTELGEYQVVAYTVNGEFLYRAGESIADLDEAKRATEEWYRKVWASRSDTEDEEYYYLAFEDGPDTIATEEFDTEEEREAYIQANFERAQQENVTLLCVNVRPQKSGERPEIDMFYA